MSDRLEEIIRCIRAQEPELRRRGVQHLAVFGSMARRQDRPDSDIDIAVEIEPGRSFSLITLEDTRLLLQDMLGQAVDLGEVEGLRRHVRPAFERDRATVF